jgi:hypothetical protein
LSALWGLLGLARAEQVWVSPSVSLAQAGAAVERLGVTAHPQPVTGLQDRLTVVVLHRQHGPCPRPVPLAQLTAALDDALTRVQLLDLPGALSAASQATDELACLDEPVPPPLLFALPLVTAEIHALAGQAEPTPRHRSEQLAALTAAAAVEGEPPLSLDPELARELTRIRHGQGVGTVRAAGGGAVYLDGRRLTGDVVSVREGRHLVQLVRDGVVLAAEEIDVVAGTASLVWGAPEHPVSADWALLSGVTALERTGQAHMMLGPALSAGGLDAPLLVTGGPDGLVVWGLDGDRLHRRLQTDAPPPDPAVILPDDPYGIRFVGLVGQWLGAPGVGGGLTGWVATSERGRLSLSLGAASMTDTWSGTGQSAGLLPITAGLRRRGAVWELGVEAGGAAAIRLGEESFRPMLGLVGALSMPPTTSAALHLQLSGGWLSGGGWAALAVGVGLQ